MIFFNFCFFYNCQQLSLEDSLPIKTHWITSIYFSIYGHQSYWSKFLSVNIDESIIIMASPLELSWSIEYHFEWNTLIIHLMMIIISKVPWSCTRSRLFRVGYAFSGNTPFDRNKNSHQTPFGSPSAHQPWQQVSPSPSFPSTSSPRE